MVVSVVSFKRKYSDDEHYCIFCNKTNNIVLQPRVETYVTVHRAAERRKDDVSKRLAYLYRPDEERQPFSWHRSCLASYISEDKIKRREAALSTQTLNRDGNFRFPNDQQHHFGRRNAQRTDKIVCVVCSQKSRKKDEKLFTLCERPAAEKFIFAAKEKKDEVFTRICTCESAEDLLAQEIRYHKSCLRDYTYVRKCSGRKPGRPSETIPHDVLKTSLDRLLEEIGTGFENKAYELTYLTNKLIELCGIDGATIENRITKNLLVDKFGEKVIFSHPSDRSKPSLVMMSSIPMEQMAEKIRELDSLEKSLKLAAVSLKEEMLENKFPCEEFIKDDSVLDKSLNDFIIPPSWASFLATLMGNKCLRGNKLRRAKSIYMDLFFTVTGIETPKHVALAESVHHLTRSKHIVTMLFRLGHCISYTALQDTDRELWRKVMFDNQSEKCPLPANIVRNDSLFLHGAIDNNDFSEETLSGKNTTHITAMVVYQEKCGASFSGGFQNAVKRKDIDNASFLHPETLPCQTILGFQNHSKAPMSNSSVQIPAAQNGNFCRDSEILRILLKSTINDDLELIRVDNSGIPPWSPFQQLLNTSSIPVTTVGYCPIIPHAPTSKDVVYTAMINFMNLCHSCGKGYGVLTADMSIYMIAKRIQMQTSEFNDLTLRIGTFHLHKVWLRCLGQFLEGSGIETVVVDAGVYGENTFQSILNGLHYNRGVRAHKLLYETLRYLQISEFLKTSEELALKFSSMSEIFQELRKAIRHHDSEMFCETYELVSSELQRENLFERFDKFMEERGSNEETVKFFMQYCEMVEILLESIKADREGNFDLHISSVRKMLPYFFSMNHHIYARGVTLYLQDMHQLPDNVENDLRSGMLSVKRNEGSFNAVGCDLALEQSQIRSSAVSGGLIGITKKQEAMEKWILLHPVKNSIYNVLTSFCDMNNDPTGDVSDSFSHNEWMRSRIKRDEADCKGLTDQLSEKLIFSDKDEILPLHNICNGKIADHIVSINLLTLKDRGEEMLAELVKSCFENREKSIFEKMKRADFRNLNYSKKPVTGCMNVVAENQMKKIKETMNVQKTVMLAVQREYDLKVLSKYEMLEYPRSLVDREGFMKKPAKHTLLSSLESEVNCVCDYKTIVSSSSAGLTHIFDGMSVVFIVQPSRFSTFGEFAKSFYSYITAFFSSNNVERIDVVFDRYDDISIKHTETKRRSKGSNPVEVKIMGPNTKIPKNIKNFLSSTANKDELVTFLCQYATKFVKLNENQGLIISGGFQERGMCFKIQGNDLTEVCELRSNHLEADTRIFVHALHAARDGLHIMIHSSDTDVFVLGIHFWQRIKELNCLGLWMKIVSKRSRILGCHIISESLGTPITNVLPALHAYTGCDTTSKISTKHSALQLVKQSDVQNALKPLGKGEVLADDEMTALEEVYLKLMKKSGKTLDEARHTLISRSSGFGLDLDKLPCTSDALCQHTLRASAQTYIWINSFKPIYEPIDFTIFGYKFEDNCLVPRLQTKSSAPEDLIAPCNCKRRCKSIKCSCKKQGIKCIKLCSCFEEDCKND